VFVPGKPFQPSLMFVSKAGAYLNEAPLRCSTLGCAPSLTHQHETKLERPARDKHSSLLDTFVNYRCKRFMTLGPGCYSLKKISDLALLSFCIIEAYLVSDVYFLNLLKAVKKNVI